ncbi:MULTISPECIES: FCD domain-containing protein [unclassified Mesorhizobium]|uniref:FadR/GntR family transcriptional regulator n=1 Tax=unclassified Mesorhizobium TaxID=325217 RepID=UPI000BB070C3|nr:MULTISPECIES: FCD domain-containing protein [unclassified Mesorhizobium]TGT57281.1 FadR family transcriptional regulator [Mesorhizobium sp. M00.F.Ca.ET.170.01.1.1]AZO11964.1 FadR family transcriptional regulator [Mesorhizobium sp. M3A.F.Ca.ET.080.04.2.1]PBB86140.1 GntR family transcriptional regulator [Mesorhizobium sp. WSM3876]RWB66747.1 MAG: FadR family transcriptional regulator [Mesorhizobium sp.]RWB90697.1 MAG: FadR family transcriptional regulator [Mesorhizobium sp.]
MTVVLRDFIEAEGLQPGDRLPPERDLAVKLGLPRTALRRMLAEMEQEGRLLRHVGRGTFVAERGATASAPYRAQNASRKELWTYPAEVFEARLIIEPKVAALAALRATPYETEEMQKVIQHGSTAATLAEFERWDAAFHQLVVAAARNGLLASLYEGIHSLRAGRLWGRMKEQSLTKERMQEYTAHHRAILQAIIDRDGGQAEQRMHNHILTARANILGSETMA